MCCIFCYLLPAIFSFVKPALELDFLFAGFNIVKRHRIGRQERFDRVVKCIIKSVGNTFSANSIATFLKSSHREVSAESVRSYLCWLEQAFILHSCERYDLKGKKNPEEPEKILPCGCVAEICPAGL